LKFDEKQHEEAIDELDDAADCLFTAANRFAGAGRARASECAARLALAVLELKRTGSERPS